MPIRGIAGVIGRRMNLPVVAVPVEAVGQHFGWLGHLLSIDNPTSSALTRERMGRRPVQPSLIPDLEQGRCFED